MPKDILVHVDNSRACGPRIEAAVKIANQFGAHLSGLYVRPRLTVIPPYIAADLDPAMMTIQTQAVDAQAEEAKSRFDTIAAASDLTVEWRCVEGGLARTINTHARYADLVVLGQADADDPKSVSDGLADRVVLESGRPVLVIPYIGFPEDFAERALVAWNGSREAVRAVNDAMPFLQAAKRVDVLAIDPDDAENGHGDIPSADICLHLARHGVNAHANHITATDIDVGDMLLSRVADAGANLIVMGAYGRSRFREIVLGGATRHLLRHMTVPVLMSH